jgi:hypothetical protein
MSIEERISTTALERWVKSKSPLETQEITLWANDQLRLVGLWNRTGVKPEGLEFE